MPGASGGLRRRRAARPVDPGPAHWRRGGGLVLCGGHAGTASVHHRTLRPLGVFVAVVVLMLSALAGCQRAVDRSPANLLPDLAGLLPGSPLDEAQAALRRRGMRMTFPQALPDGHFVTLGVPLDEDCIPAAEWLRCPMVRLFTASAASGDIVLATRVYKRLPIGTRTEALLSEARRRWGVEAEQEAYSEVIRGGLLSLLALRWPVQASVLVVLHLVLDDDNGAPADMLRGVGISVERLAAASAGRASSPASLRAPVGD